MGENNSSESTITTPVGSVSWKGKRMSEFIAILCLCLLFLLAYVLWEHKAEAKADSQNLTTAIKEMTAAQREMSCIFAYKGVASAPADIAEFCRRITR